MNSFFHSMSDILKTTIAQSKTAPIYLFVRHCHFSKASAHKKRPKGFSREKCHENLMATLEQQPKVHVTFFLDTFFPMEGEHFIKKQSRYPVIEISEGNEAASFLRMLDYVMGLSLDPEAIVYFLEDDYLHKEDWACVLREGLAIEGVDYVTLYDHQDKYFMSLYRDLESKLYITPSTHWRTTPSTTNTYAMKMKTLLRDKEIHQEFSIGRTITDDHAKFCKLKEKGCKLLSPVPGWSTHMEPEYLSPCVDWDVISLPKSCSRKKWKFLVS